MIFNQGFYSIFLINFSKKATICHCNGSFFDRFQERERKINILFKIWKYLLLIIELNIYII